MWGAIARIGGSLLSKTARGAVTATRGLSNIPAVKSIAKQTGIGALAYGAGNMLFGGSSGNTGIGGGLPPLPGMPALPQNPWMGDRSILGNDPNLPDALKPYAISKGNLKPYYRAPKGFVIVYDSVGDPYALPKKMAQWLKLWKPAHKPPISVGDWQAIKRADRTVAKMRKIFRVTTRVDKSVTGGKVTVTRSKKGGR